MEFMNKPVITEVNNSDIIREYNKVRDIKAVARIFNVHPNKVRGALKKAGIQIGNGNKHSSMYDVGLSERDFY